MADCNRAITQANLASFSSSGDNAVIAAVAGQVIRVYGVEIRGGTATVIKFLDGAGGSAIFTPLGTQTSVAQFGPLPDGRPLYTLTAGNAFVINLGAANAFGGSIWYNQS